ncbi:hypothetical protein RCG24_07855 [Neobacillus sp. OS1-32]|uniref:hypothetical protein n=1 Tax=Neobacillus sp. OS1-32 TaxID=3070682 RepID=UPI0027DFBC6E|nr:hypothetical protein [Neobacillus sp. OS1-32]WML31752.1 hypothetical protein RCG24_07855 [Neobacillus sp. OS1-32]
MTATKGKYGKYIISEPKVENVAYHPMNNVKGVTFPDEIYLDGTILEGSPVVVDIGWRFSVPDPDPVEWEHTHDFDEVLCFIGSDPENPHDLGAEIEFHIGGEAHTFSKNTTIFVPKGTPHCPFYHKRVDRPFLLVVFAMNPKYPSAEEDKKKNPEKYTN